MLARPMSPNAVLPGPFVAQMPIAVQQIDRRK